MKERGKKKRKKKKGKKGKPPRQSLSLVCFVHEKKDSRIHRAARMKKPYIFVRNDKTIDLSAIEGDPRFRTDFEPSGLLNFQDRHSFPRGKDIYIYIWEERREGGAINNRAGKSWRGKLYSTAACSFDLRRADIIYTRAMQRATNCICLLAKPSSTPDNHANYDFPRYFEHVNRPNCEKPWRLHAPLDPPSRDRQ